MDVEKFQRYAKPEETWEEVMKVGIQALKIFGETRPAQGLRLYRGEFLKLGKESLKDKKQEEEEVEKMLEKGLVSRAIRLGVDIAEELKSNLRGEPLSHVAELHAYGKVMTFWKEGKAFPVTLTPFVSLTTRAETALRAAMIPLELKQQMDMGMYVNDDGTPSSEFYERLAELFDEGRPVVYVVEVPKENVYDLNKVSDLTISELGDRVIANSKNPYNEQEFITLQVKPNYLLGFILLNSNPFKEKEWRWQVKFF
jgi:hypothetical protein